MSKFQQGHVYYPRSEAGKLRMKFAMSGDKNPAKRPDIRKKISEKRKGNKGRLDLLHSQETKKKISKAHKGKKKPWAGKFLTEKGREILRSRSGNKNTNWKGGITPIHYKIRNSLEYKLWRKSVFERDNYTCVWCGIKGYVEADHIKPFANYPELRFAIDNGRTLCRPCHDTTKYGRGTKKL